MNTLEKAVHEIENFLTSNEKCMLLKGTNQYKKHPLVISLINQSSENIKLLFRVNALQNLDTFLQINQKLKTGTPYKYDKNILYIDSINSQSWTKTPNDFDYAVIYPIDSIIKSNQRDSIMLDVFRRAKKVILVSWTDSYDYSSIANVIDRIVTYDAEAEDPDYHARVLEFIHK